jgi:proteasome regulatory subunit
MTTKDDVNKIIYNYAATSNHLEEEVRVLRSTVNQLNKEIETFKQAPLMLCEVREIQDENTAMIKIPNGNQFWVNIAPGCEALVSGDNVLVEQKNLNIIKKVERAKKFNVESFVIIDKPVTSWKDIGGLGEQAKEIQEVVELPIIKPELFKKVGIIPPKGILLHGPPGTGKTLLAKAVAASTNSTFIEIVGSELVQKFIGEGAKLVKDVFDLAREKAPAIIFIDEIDALAASRIEIGTSGEREVQRTFMQFLAELDGFKPLGNVKVIGCTNRMDILDPAILRPGRLDRLIEVNNPTKEGMIDILAIHTKKMNLDKDIKFDDLVKKMVNFSGAEIRAVCTESGYYAIRERRSKVSCKDFIRAIEKIKQKEEADGEEFTKMFG